MYVQVKRSRETGGCDCFTLPDIDTDSDSERLPHMDTIELCRISHCPKTDSDSNPHLRWDWNLNLKQSPSM